MGLNPFASGTFFYSMTVMGIFTVFVLIPLVQGRFLFRRSFGNTNNTFSLNPFASGTFFIHKSVITRKI